MAAYAGDNYAGLCSRKQIKIGFVYFERET
jgi:hypothetical protein